MYVLVCSSLSLPRHKMLNSDLSRIINSEEIQKQLRKKGYDSMSKIFFYFCLFVHRPSRSPRAPLKKNPLKNRQAMLHLNPYARVQRKNALKVELKRKKAREDAIAKKRGQK